MHTHRPFAAEYDVGEAIGTGGFAVVRKATRKATGEVFAVKTLRVKGDSRQKGGRPDGAASDEASDEASDASGLGLGLGLVRGRRLLGRVPRVVASPGGDVDVRDDERARDDAAALGPP